MENLELRDRALMVLAELELGYDRTGKVPNELVTAAIHRHATGPRGTWALLRVVSEELGLEPAPQPQASPWWLLAGALVLVPWVLLVCVVWVVWRLVS